MKAEAVRGHIELANEGYATYQTLRKKAADALEAWIRLQYGIEVSVSWNYPDEAQEFQVLPADYLNPPLCSSACEDKLYDILLDLFDTRGIELDVLEEGRDYYSIHCGGLTNPHRSSCPFCELREPEGTEA